MAKAARKNVFFSRFANFLFLNYPSLVVCWYTMQQLLVHDAAIAYT